MIIYLVSFFSSIFLLKISGWFKKNQRWIFFAIGLLIPCILAGLRADTIGTDVRLYLKPSIEAALKSDNFMDYLNSSWISYWKQINMSNYEIGFSLLIYICSKLFKSVCVVQLIIQIIIIMPIFLAIKKKKVTSVWLGMLTFYLMEYNVTLNMIRQSMAMGLLLLAFIYFEKNEYKKSIILYILSTLFHLSASIIALIILISYIFIKNADRQLNLNKWYNSSRFRMCICMFVAVILLFSTNAIVWILNLLGLSRYGLYISGYLVLLPNQIIVRMPIICLCLFNWKAMKVEKTNRNFYFVMIFYDLICSQFASVNPYGGRIGYYFSQFAVLLNPMMYRLSKHKVITLIGIIGYMLFYWWFYFAFSNIGETVPYKIM